MSNCQCSTILASSCRNPLILCGEVRLFHRTRGFRALGQNRFESFIALRCFSMLSMTRTLIVSGANTRPGAEVCSTGKSAHIQTDFRQNHLSAAPGDAGNLAKSRNRRYVFIHVILNQFVQVGDSSVQIIDMVYHLRQQFSLQRRGDSLNRRNKLPQL